MSEVRNNLVRSDSGRRMTAVDFEDIGNSDLVLYQIGREKCRPTHFWGPAVRTHHLLHYVVSGSGIFEWTTREGDVSHRRIEAGQAFIIFPGLKASYCADPDDPWEYMWLEFEGTCITVPLCEAGLTPENPILIPKGPAESNRIETIMLAILNSRDESYAYLMAQGFHFLEAVAAAGRTSRQKSKKRNETFYIEKAMKYIKNNYNSDIRVEDLANICSINRSYFSKLFKKELGQTPQEFLIQYRVNKACDLLLRTDKQIHEIAAEIGYPDPLHFSKVFKSVMGVSPQMWRSENK